MLARHPRFVFHFTPTSGLLAQCGRGRVRPLDQARLDRGAVCSVEELKRVIHDLIADTNAPTATRKS
jgi:hypothetical protein